VLGPLSSFSDFGVFETATPLTYHRLASQEQEHTPRRLLGEVHRRKWLHMRPNLTPTNHCRRRFEALPFLEFVHQRGDPGIQRAQHCHAVR
jgi:hypothetical protein